MKQRLLVWRHRLDALPVPTPFRFLLVGATGVGVNMGALSILVGGLGLPLALAGALAVETSIWSNFLLNDAWTFGASRTARPWWARAAVFQATAALAAGVNLGLLLLLTSVAGLHYLGADLVAIAAASAINFGVSASWTWRAKPSSVPTSVADAGWDARRGVKRVAVIPTYNEAGNIGRLLARVLSLGEEYEALVVDDSSPDGTAAIVAAMGASERRVHLMRREGKMGLGTAYVAGFREALSLGADLIYQMDGDFSHDPQDLRRLGAAAASGEVAIGSRYVTGGRTLGWPLHRLLMSRAMNCIARVLLAVPVHDVTGGFKCWSRRALASLPLDSVRSTGFAFQIEMNYLAWRAGFSLVEVPITFEDRKAGQSKASLGIGVEMVAVVCRLLLAPPRPGSSLRPSLSKDSG